MSDNADFNSNIPPPLVAHRGWASQFPENTLPAVTAALSAGAVYVEIDVQVTKDGIPVLLHDATLDRTTSQSGIIHELTWHDLADCDAGESARFGRRFQHTPLPTLYEFIQLLSAWPNVTAFVEIKEESLAYFGIENIADSIIEIIRPLAPRIIPISYNSELLTTLRDVYQVKQTGWVMHLYNDDSLAIARQLAPDFLFCNYRKINGAPQQGPWRWVCYEITSAALAQKLMEQGIGLVETMAIGELLSDPLWASARSIHDD